MTPARAGNQAVDDSGLMNSRDRFDVGVHPDRASHRLYSKQRPAMFPIGRERNYAAT
jgi:hypothetical protein